MSILISISGDLRCMSLLCLWVLLSTWPSLSASPTQFEAAFQGRCGPESPCDQLCIELHDGTYECDCQLGYDLQPNGYTCTPGSKTDSSGGGEEIDVIYLAETSLTAKDAEAERVQSGPTLSEYQDEPPQQAEDDIDKDETPLDGPHVTPSITPPTTTRSNRLAAAETEAEEVDDEDEGSEGGEDEEEGEEDEEEDGDNPVSDNCERQCSTGRCIEGSTGRKVCQCPSGFQGNDCQTRDVDMDAGRFPRFHGGIGKRRSYLAFSPLRGAYRDLDLLLEFHPEAPDGVLLVSGEREDLSGDYVALLLRNGYLEFRFDCGSGTGVLRSTDPVRLHRWNRVHVERHGWEAHLQLNRGHYIKSKSQGVFSRITFRKPLFVGDLGSMTAGANKLALPDNSTGFRGCIKHLQINRRVYDFRFAPSGDAIEGWDIAECDTELCSSAPCLHGGKCMSAPCTARGLTCLCPLGFLGEFCETPVDLQVPSFNGSSHLRYGGPEPVATLFLDLELSIQPKSNDGLLLFSGRASRDSGNDEANPDFFALLLRNGYVEFIFDLGSGQCVLKSPERLTLGDWHKIRVMRTGREALLKIEGQHPVVEIAPGAFTQMTLSPWLYLGGLPALSLLPESVNMNSGFTGCVQKLVVNEKNIRLLSSALSGLNVEGCSSHRCGIETPCGTMGRCMPNGTEYQCSCPIGWYGPACDQEWNMKESMVPRFSGRSFLHFTGRHIDDQLNGHELVLSLRFKTTKSGGLLLWAGRKDRQDSDWLSLNLMEGRLQLRYNLGSGTVAIWNNSTSRVDDGLWHRVQVVRRDQAGWLSVDDAPPVGDASPGVQRFLDVNTGLYIGGIDSELFSGKEENGLIGCVVDVLVGTVRLRLLQDAVDGSNIAPCP